MAIQHKQASLPYNIAVFGAEDTGKSAFIERVVSGQFSKEKCTKKLQATRPFNTTHGKIEFFVKEFAAGVPETVPPHIDGAIIFIDGSETATDIAKILGDTPTVFVISKCDRTIRGKAAPSLRVNSPSRLYEISSKSLYNIENPLLHLARVIKEDAHLIFI